MSIAKNIEIIISKTSWIRKMFEEGARLKAEHGAENVFDFSLGNPNIEPPEVFKKTLQEIVNTSVDGMHGYMPNAGYPPVRAKVAEYLSEEQHTFLTANEIIMTCGAAGALNTILKAILDSGDEVIAPTPCFVEYGAYCANHGGVFKTVPTKPDFTLDIDAISEAITDKTKAVLINFPNNPTGQIYTEDNLKALGTLLKDAGQKLKRTIYLLSDEPYRKIIYDGIKAPSIFSCYPDSILATSYSKDLSIPGERIGFLAVNPQAEFKDDLINAMTLTNRILGYVNAPALMQRVIASLQGKSVDMSLYARKRDLLCDGLSDCGYTFTKPAGAFYLFPQTPIPDDVKFVQALQEELILGVPGSGFYGPGHFRLAFCVPDETIINAMPAFKRVMDRFK
ncbi:pyridoxal phosphate-dependent aminotransferase [Desulfococcaceae bacterium HSG9]|nr:pyridoxal phosphate-dependent aminotransferase [Desulfococcaceae bacterium HSG9]